MDTPIVPEVSRLELVLRLADGDRVGVVLPLSGGDTVAGYEITVNGDPVVSASFAWHEDSRRYHTMCRRAAADIDELEML